MAPVTSSRVRNWQQLVLHHQALIDDFIETCDAPEAARFLRYLCTAEAASWMAPFATLAKPLPRGKARAIAKRLDKLGTTCEDGLLENQKRTAADWRLLAGTRYGRQVERPERLLFFSALVPYMKWRRGSPDWQWLARFIAATEGRAPGTVDAADATRAWWKKTLRQAHQQARGLVTTGSASIAQRRRLQRHLLLSRTVLDAAWAFVRFLNSCRPLAERAIIQGHLYHRKSPERHFVRRGLIPTFGGLRERRFTTRRIVQLREDGLLGTHDHGPDENWIELLPKIG